MNESLAHHAECINSAAPRSERHGAQRLIAAAVSGIEATGIDPTNV
jgi:hypothetical protein